MHHIHCIPARLGMLLIALAYQKEIIPVITHTVKPDGSVLVAGSTRPKVDEKKTIGIARFKNMFIDPTFGLKIPDSSNISDAKIAFDPDNKLVLAQNYYDKDQVKSTLQIKRYNEDGSPDTTFGTNGISSTNVNPQIIGIAFYRDKKFVIALRNALIQYTPEGNLDTSFNKTGMINFKSPIKIVDIAIDGNDRIVMASENASQNLVRYTKTGAFDTSFNSKLQNGLEIEQIYVEPSADIILICFDQKTEKQLIKRLDKNGAVDTKFTIEKQYEPSLQIFSLQDSEKKSYVGVLFNPYGTKILLNVYDAISGTEVMNDNVSGVDAFC